MKVILSVGCPNSGHDQVFALLVKAGVFTARSCSKRGLSPQSMQEQLLRTQEVDLESDRALDQVQVGRLWNELAADLFLTNTDQAVWGWADHRTAVLMDFWSDFDPQVRILLVYNPPHAYLEQTLSQCEQVNAEMVDVALDQWFRWNTALLRYFHRHSKRCLLVNSQRALVQPQAFLEVLASQWHTRELTWSTADTSACPAHPKLQGYLINEMIDAQSPAWALHQELESVTSFKFDRSTEQASNAYQAWADWRDLRAELARLNLSTATLKSDNMKLEREIAELGVQCEIKTKEATLCNQSKQEYDHLLLQLHQVQEEHEHYYLRCQELERQQQTKAIGFVTDFWRLHQPTVLQIDMLQEVSGENWYYPESDGRWAGPATRSTIQMPPLRAGDYTLELDVVDAMSVDLVKTMLVEALDQSIPVDIAFNSQEADYPLVCKAAFCITPEASSKQWQIGLRFSHTVCPADSGVDDYRSLAVRMRGLRLIKLP